VDVFRRGLIIAVVSWCTACASTQLTALEARSLSEKTWRAPSDEVFDATWLTLIGRGYEVASSDRVAGTLVISRATEHWDVDVAALGTEQRVVIAPRQVGSRAEFSALLEEVETGTRSLLRAWNELPEWKFDGRRNLLRVPGLSLAPPSEWEWLDYDISRRFVVVQKRRERSGLNPTLLVELDRRRPESRLQASLRRGAALCVASRQRLTVPDELESTEDQTGLHGSMRVLDGTSPVELSWHAYQTVLGASDVRLVMVCPKVSHSECRALWKDLFQSITH
jgi:hypothetical protein